MAQQIRFFKDSDDLFQMDGTVIPSGTMSLKMISDTRLELGWVKAYKDNMSACKVFEGDIKDVLKEDGSPYATVAEFKTANKAFFV